jgi:hypothetical protein
MEQSKQYEDVSPATTDSMGKSGLSRLGHWMRVAVMILSGGFIFPHAMTEDMDEPKPGADTDAEVKKQ